MPVKSPVSPTTKSEPQAMNSSWVKSRPTRYGRRKAERMAVPLKVESSPSTSNGLASGLSHSGGLRGATAVCCSAIEVLLSRECPPREVSCASADAGHSSAYGAEDLVRDGVAPGGHLLCR